MALYYGIVFAILASELPIPTRWQKPVFRWIATSPLVNAVNTLRAFYEVVNEEENGVPTGNSDFRAQVGQAAKKFYAQRNLYLTGFTILLLLILNKIKSMAQDYIRLEDEFIELEAATSNDPAVKAAARKMDTAPIESEKTKLEPVKQDNTSSFDNKDKESRKDI
ncbi:B-cell receptor-associated protein 31-like-domain-containing protein [Cokeromyces recurvatus]|uniref:B-cell receptor-associated protein 31-like-domain-containing protein n=1 Tax=Cokeromyces recurvatus TaxID=90255 RepID=UPI002220E3B3|nr:B-cell receptor-associated protein 31-like-domain-containing protein [Cokeromyces recurvatus]KAI7901153.1 B-cell receptor-associated protein 31-like-domain-containing protein [Cokeromyces recurvatus]